MSPGIKFCPVIPVSLLPYYLIPTTVLKRTFNWLYLSDWRLHKDTWDERSSFLTKNHFPETRVYEAWKCQGSWRSRLRGRGNSAQLWSKSRTPLGYYWWKEGLPALSVLCRQPSIPTRKRFWMGCSVSSGKKLQSARNVATNWWSSQTFGHNRARAGKKLSSVNVKKPSARAAFFFWNTDNSRSQGSLDAEEALIRGCSIQMQTLGTRENFCDCKEYGKAFSSKSSSVTQHHIIHVGGKSKCTEHDKASSAEYTVLSTWEAILGANLFSVMSVENSSASPNLSFSTS